MLNKITDWAENELKIFLKNREDVVDYKIIKKGCDVINKSFKDLIYGLDSLECHFGDFRDVYISLLKREILSPITDKDWDSCQPSVRELIQCPRKYSVIKEVDENGNESYRDVDRVICVDAEHPSITFRCSLSNIINDLHPIVMPYLPPKNPYKIYVKSYLTDKNHGDFDVHEVIGYEDPEGKWHDYHRFEYYSNNKETEIVVDEMRKEYLRSKRLTHPNESATYCLLKDVEYYVHTDPRGRGVTIEKDVYNEWYQLIGSEVVTSKLNYLIRPLLIEDERGICYLNTGHNHSIIAGCDINKQKRLIDEHPNLEPLVKFVSGLKDKLFEIQKWQELIKPM